jgi:hypothetical protein
MANTELFYVVGGTVPPDAPSYVRRAADAELYKRVGAGDFCYVLTTRQMGKSSLMARTVERLRGEDWAVAVVDLTEVNPPATGEGAEDRWYYGIANGVAHELDLEVNLGAWWDERSKTPRAQRLTHFFSDVVLERIARPLAVFIDEIDSTLGLPFTDDFFAAIRACYNRRATEPAYRRLTFVLLGVASPSDLVADRTRTPFNIGRRIELTDFTFEEAKPLTAGLSGDGTDGANALRHILYWTGGHPYLTQKLCDLASREEGQHSDERIDRLVEQEFFDSAAIRNEPNLRFVIDRLTAHPKQARRLLRIYRRVREGQTIADDARSPDQNELKLAGILKPLPDGQLGVRNRIYERIFTPEWAKTAVPPDLVLTRARRRTALTPRPAVTTPQPAVTPRARGRTRKLRIIAQDPAIRVRGHIVTATVEVPAEDFQPGPWGGRVQVIDYDSSTGTLLKPLEDVPAEDGGFADPFEKASDSDLLTNPQFHAQNVYAIVMLTLARFEKALGRRIAWGFSGHQLKVAPHAFADTNTFYSERDEGLFFGYFPTAVDSEEPRVVFSCLSHDVVAHETAHALLDGLRKRYADPSSPDQAGFHEGFADVVGQLSVFALPEVTALLVDRAAGARGGTAGGRIPVHKVTPDALRESALLGLAEVMGQEMAAVRGAALRQSVRLTPSPKYLEMEEFQEPHRRGEILVAAMMNAFIEVWAGRLMALGEVAPAFLDRGSVAEVGAAAADFLLTMAIRALDYSMPVHIEFGDYLSALLTADREIQPDDSKYRFRDHLRASFRAYGIEPTSRRDEDEPGVWLPPKTDLAVWPTGKSLNARTPFEGQTLDSEEVFRFIWLNRRELGLVEEAYTRVLSVHPCLRVGRDGFFLRETVAEYVQSVELEARDLRRMKIEAPIGMPKDMPVTLYGGAVLIFDEFGQVKFSINNRLDNDTRQTRRLKYLWDYGYFDRGAGRLRQFSYLHRLRAGASRQGSVVEEWH